MAGLLDSNNTIRKAALTGMQNSATQFEQTRLAKEEYDRREAELRKAKKMSVMSTIGGITGGVIGGITGSSPAGAAIGMQVGSNAGNVFGDLF